MRAAGGDQQRAGVERVAGGGLADGQRDGAVEARGERGGEAGRHVLDDQPAGAERRGQRREQLAERRGPPVEEAMTTSAVPCGAAAARSAGGRGGGGVGAAGGGGRRRGRTARHARTRPARRPRDLAAELGREALQRLAERRLGDQVEGALGERVDRAGAVGGGEGGDDDHRHGLGLAVAQRAQHAEPVEARHVQVQRERVGAVLAAAIERLVAVGGGADDLEALARQRVGEHPAHEARVVGDDDALVRWSAGRSPAGLGAARELVGRAGGAKGRRG